MRTEFLNILEPFLRSNAESSMIVSAVYAVVMLPVDLNHVQ